MSKIYTVQSERLLLRQWREEDLAPVAALNADPEVREYFPGLMSQEESDAQVAKFIELINENGWGFWAAERMEDGQCIGFIGLNRVSFDAPFTPAVEIGWRLARPFWGKGYATEGARAALDFAFNELDLGEVVAFTVVSNQRSRAVMERLGMRHDPGDDFDHPSLEPGHPLRRHVLYRKQRDN